ncbi:hypothetical protein KEM52_005105 [Ascosphaera acerosa]|nr:hypothetical protein KEM52_005105 [Ascosphaera acerosa]
MVSQRSSTTGLWDSPECARQNATRVAGLNSRWNLEFAGSAPSVASTRTSTSETYQNGSNSNERGASARPTTDKTARPLPVTTRQDVPPQANSGFTVSDTRPLSRELAEMPPPEGSTTAAGSEDTAAAKLTIISNMLAPRKLGGMSSAQIKEAGSLPWDEALYRELEERNAARLAQLAKEQEETAESGVESDVQAVVGKRAEYFAEIGDKDKAIQTFERVLSSTSLIGTKIDILLAQCRLGLFFSDRAFVQTVLDRATTLAESGGDWDRRNRLKAYRGLHLLTVRNYAAAAPLLLDSLATFTSYELCSYAELVVFAVMAGSLALRRVDFKAK